jgi:hypothetical protein
MFQGVSEQNTVALYSTDLIHWNATPMDISANNGRQRFPGFVNAIRPNIFFDNGNPYITADNGSGIYYGSLVYDPVQTQPLAATTNSVNHLLVGTGLGIGLNTDIWTGQYAGNQAALVVNVPPSVDGQPVANSLQSTVVIGTDEGDTIFNTGPRLSIGSSTTNDILWMGQNGTGNAGDLWWYYNATAANAYFALDTRGGNNPIAIANSGGKVGVGGVTSPTGRFEIGSNKSLAAWGLTGADFAVDALTLTDNSTAASTVVTNNMSASIGIPTLAATNTAVTYTNAASLYIAGSPAAGSHVTITNPYALDVGAGNSYFGGPVVISPGYTVGTLPAGVTGMRAYVTDQTTACPLAGAALTGNGAVTCPVFYNGSAWVGD